MKTYQWLVSSILALLLVVGLLTAITPANAQGNVYYVDPAGLDTTGDGSIGNPWATIQHAVAQVTAGDTVLINPGTYDGNIIVETSGTATQPITFRANGPGVIIDGTVNNWSGDAILITEADHIIVEGLTIQDADRAGLRISLSDHVTVRNCTFANNYRWGVFTDFSNYTTIENSESYGASDEHGIYISNSSDYPIIRGNRLHHNNSCGLHMNGDISMGGDGIISGAMVEDNIIYENGAAGGSGINMDGVTHSTVRNNLLYDNHASGISLYQIDGGSGSHDNRVLNNTIIMPSGSLWGINIPDTNDTNNELYNNIIYNYGSWRGSILIDSPTLTGFESDYNIVMDRFTTDYDTEAVISLAQWQALGYDTHSIIATPADLFVDVPADDYHLKSDSPAIDLGTALLDVIDDLEGNPRPLGTSHDAGAYEYAGDTFSLTADPATQRIYPGNVTTYTISVQPTGDFSNTVTLTATHLSPYLTVSLNPNSVDPPGYQTTLTVTDTHPGSVWPVVSYTIGITGTGGGFTRTVDINLGVASNQAPNVPSNPNPAHNAVDVSPASVLNWQSGDPNGDPVTYTVYFGTQYPPSLATTTTNLQYTPSSLLTDTMYYWQITATDGMSTSIGPTWQFTITAGAATSDSNIYLPIIFSSGEGGSTPSGTSPQIDGCDVFPADNIWNTPIDNLPVNANSVMYINTIGYNTTLHADFGQGDYPLGSGSPIGIPFTTVSGTQPLVNVSFYYDEDSDAGPYPIPADAPIEGGPDSNGDRHVLVLDRGNCILYEMYDSWPQSDGSWEAGSGAIFDLNSHELREEGWTSADAAGLPILPGLVRYDEVVEGEIRHAIRFTAPQTRRAYVWPARHFASSLTGQQYPPMGQRFRLKANFDISGFDEDMQVILQAMKTYGIILADNGSSWYISGVPDERWDNDLLHWTFDQVEGQDFEAVDVITSLMINSDSGQARQ